MIKINIDGKPLPKIEIDKMKDSVEKQKVSSIIKRNSIIKKISFVIFALFVSMIIQGYGVEKYLLSEQFQFGLIIALIGVILSSISLYGQPKNDRDIFPTIFVLVAYAGNVLFLNAFINNNYLIFFDSLLTSYLMLFHVFKIRSEKENIDKVAFYLKEAEEGHEYSLRSILDKEVIKSYVNKLDRKLLAVELVALENRYKQLEEDEKIKKINDEVYPNLNQTNN
jgi:hypothetical protein